MIELIFLIFVFLIAIPFMFFSKYKNDQELMDCYVGLARASMSEKDFENLMIGTPTNGEIYTAFTKSGGFLPCLDAD